MEYLAVFISCMFIFLTMDTTREDIGIKNYQRILKIKGVDKSSIRDIINNRTVKRNEGYNIGRL